MEEKIIKLIRDSISRYHTKRINNKVLISIVMNNIQKTEDWIMIAIEDYSDAIADFKDGRYPSSVFHAQQCTEKALKALLSFFGIAHEKTHFPSDILGESILNDPEISSKFQFKKWLNLQGKFANV